MRLLLSFLVIALFLSCNTAKKLNAEEEWKPLFNGTDLQGWIPKIRHHPLGDNFANTFRVVDGVMQVRYDGYPKFNETFGHIFYKAPFSNYHLRLEYRFTGNWLKDTPAWAYRNSGIMFHCQDPATMGLDQDFPISIEYQLLGGLGDGKERTTGNMCSPGTDIVYQGKIDSRHCISSNSKTYDGDQWVKAELIVYNDSIVHHIINGDTVMTYSKPRVFGGNVDAFQPDAKKDGFPLKSGWISLQSEGSPLDFRNIEIKALKPKLIVQIPKRLI